MHEPTATSWRDLSLFAPTDEHRLLAETVHAFVRQEVEPQAAQFNREERFNLEELFRRAGDLGLLGLTVPEHDGGAGLDAVAAVLVHEALSAADPGFCLAYLAHAILFVNNFARNASPEQRARVLPKAMSGEWIGGMCMTEPEAGTDVLGMRSQAVRDGDHYNLTGRKIFITNGAVDDHTLGDVFIVYAKTNERITTFLVEKGFPGFSLGQKLRDKLGMRASMTAELVFDGCVIPAANLIGHEGESAKHMMRNLEIERLTLAAMSLGIALRCLEVMVTYASERKTFGVLIREHGQIQRHIAESYAEFKAARCYVYDVARRLNLDSYGNRAEADAAKLFAARIAKEIADRAIQVLGGYGYMGEYVVERLWRDAKLLEIGGGTVEAHHKNITKDLARAPELIRQ